MYANSTIQTFCHIFKTNCDRHSVFSYKIAEFYRINATEPL